MRLLVTRPGPGGEATAERLRALGHEVLLSPLFVLAPIGWELPRLAIDAVLLTSANAARLAGDKIAGLTHLPCYAVGAATARAAKAAGFKEIIVGEADAADILTRAAAQGIRSMLHLAGRDHRDTEHSAIRLERRIVYAAEPIGRFDETAEAALQAGAIDWTLLYSPRAARHFAALVDRLSIPRAALRLAALSPAVAEAAGPGWLDVRSAARPNEQALFAALPGLCEKTGTDRSRSSGSPGEESNG